MTWYTHTPGQFSNVLWKNTHRYIVKYDVTPYSLPLFLPPSLPSSFPLFFTHAQCCVDVDHTLRPMPLLLRELGEARGFDAAVGRSRSPAGHRRTFPGPEFTLETISGPDLLRILPVRTSRHKKQTITPMFTCMQEFMHACTHSCMHACMCIMASSRALIRTKRGADTSVHYVMHICAVMHTREHASMHTCMHNVHIML